VTSFCGSTLLSASSGIGVIGRRARFRLFVQHDLTWMDFPRSALPSPPPHDKTIIQPLSPSRTISPILPVFALGSDILYNISTRDTPTRSPCRFLLHHMRANLRSNAPSKRIILHHKSTNCLTISLVCHYQTLGRRNICALRL